MITEGVSLSIAFGAGLLSFASPCVLPLFPSYLSFLTGLSHEEMRSGEMAPRVRLQVVFNSLFFIAGFTAIFVALGASVSYAGKLLYAYQNGIRIGGGILITMFGLYVGDRALGFRLQSLVSGWPDWLAGGAAGLLMVLGLAGIQEGAVTLGGVAAAVGLYAAAAAFFPALSGEKRIHLQSKPAGWAGSFLVGVTFAAGWTPCVGPILGSILLFAGTQQTAGRGILLLSAYSAGLAVPFLLSGLGIGYFLRYYASFRSYFRAVELGSSAVMLALGLLLISNYLSILSTYLILWTGYTGV